MPINYSKYPPNWKTEIVPRILARANNRCERCWLENKQTVFSVALKIQGDNGRYQVRPIWFSAYRDAERTANMHGGLLKPVEVCLQVAHLDHDPENNQVKDERLKALCQMCHAANDAGNKWESQVLYKQVVI